MACDSQRQAATLAHEKRVDLQPPRWIPVDWAPSCYRSAVCYAKRYPSRRIGRWSPRWSQSPILCLDEIASELLPIATQPVFLLRPRWKDMGRFFGPKKVQVVLLRFKMPSSRTNRQVQEASKFQSQTSERQTCFTRGCLFLQCSELPWTSLESKKLVLFIKMPW